MKDNLEREDFKEVLEKESCEEYTLVGEWCWITANNISIEIIKYSNTLAIFSYPLGKEDSHPTTKTLVPWSEGA